MTSTARGVDSLARLPDQRPAAAARSAMDCMICDSEAEVGPVPTDRNRPWTKTSRWPAEWGVMMRGRRQDRRRRRSVRSFRWPGWAPTRTGRPDRRPGTVDLACPNGGL